MVDRMPPRRLVNWCDALSAVVATSMALPGMPVPALLALLVCLGTLSSVAAGGRGALVRATVPLAAYVPARSLLKIASQTAQIGGNVIGGALLVVLGTSGAILVNAATFAVSFALVRLVVGNHPNPGTSSQAGVLGDSLRGVREIFAQPALGRLLILGWLVLTFSVAPEALGAPYVSAHHGSPALVGWWLAALPIGTIAGDLVGVRFMRQTLQQRLVVPVAAAGFVPYLFFVLDPPVGVALALLVVSGAFGMYSLGLDGRIRDAAPERLFARTMALNSAGLMTLQGLGFAFAGAVAQAIGSAGAIGLAGACGLVAVAVLRSLPQPEPSVAPG